MYLCAETGMLLHVCSRYMKSGCLGTYIHAYIICICGDMYLFARVYTWTSTYTHAQFTSFKSVLGRVYRTGRRDGEGWYTLAGE